MIPFFDWNLHSGRLENVGYDLELRPYSWLGIESDATYNTITRDFETVNADFYVEKGGTRLSVGQRYIQDQSSQTTAQIRLKLGRGLELKIYDRYEFEEKRSKEFEATVSKVFDCVILDVTYNHRDGDSFYFVLRLKAFPTVSFGLDQEYNHPKTRI